MSDALPEKLYLLPFYAASARAGHVALVTGRHLQDIRLYSGIDAEIPLGPSDRILVNLGPVQVYELRHIVSPHLYRQLSEPEPKELVYAPALAIPDHGVLDQYLYVPPPETTAMLMLQLVRNATATWLQLVSEDTDIVVAARGADIEVAELPDPEPDTQPLLLIIYNQMGSTDRSASLSNLLVLAIPASELERDIRIRAPFARDRDVILERAADGVQKFWLSDILLGSETEPFIRAVQHEFQTEPGKRYTTRRLRSACIASYTQAVPATITYRIPVGSDTAIPVSIRIPGDIQFPLAEPEEQDTQRDAP